MSTIATNQGSRAPAAVSAAPAARALGLRANLAWTLCGNVTYAASQWGILIVLAKLIGPETVGQFSLGLAVTAPVFMLTNLQLRAVQATDARRDFEPGHYLALRLIMTAVGWLAIAGLVRCGRFQAETALVVLTCALAKGIESVSDVFYGLLQQHERMDKIAISMIVKGMVSLGVLAATVAVSGRTVWGIAALAASWATVLLLYDLPACAAFHDGHGCRERLPRPRWSKAHLLRLSRLALPLGIVMMLISLIASIPRYFIEGALGHRALGIFSAMAYLMVAGNTVVFALGQAASPRLARYYASGRIDAFRTLLFRLVVMAVAGGGAAVAVVLAWGRPILQALYTADYARSTDVFLWLTIAATLGAVASFLGYGMTAARCFRAQAPLFAIVTLATTFACALLIPRYGLLGAGLASTVGAIVQLLGSAWVIHPLLRGGHSTS